MPCYSPMALKKPDERGMLRIVPCSMCIGCRLERSRQWAVRCINEAQMHKENAFITMTYRDEELVHGHQSYTLFPRHLQLFMKRYRKAFSGKTIRYFACGEYGDSTRRPHYHACIFGHDFSDKTIYTIKNGNTIFSSKLLDSIWGLGDCKIGALTFESAAYVARYIVGKKLGKTAHEYDDEGIEPEFVRMSRKPGIGASWFNKFESDIFPRDYQIIRGNKSKPPRYYFNKYAEKHEAESKLIKINRVNESYKKLKDNTKKRLLVKQTVKNSQIKNLSRNTN